MRVLHEYRTIDKSGWGEGEWQEEPDKVQWRDEPSGLPCLAKRGRFGGWCGYVGVAEGHRLYGKSWLEDDLSLAVHGGVNYSGPCGEGPEETSICHRPEEGEADDVWWFGFDCGHGGDMSPAMKPLFPDLDLGPEIYRNLAYVEAQCAMLAAQLAEVE